MSRQSSTTAPKSSGGPGVTAASNRALQRPSSLGDHLCVQREASGAHTQPSASALVRGVVNSPGQPLDADTRSTMESRIGYDLSGVRIHTDGQAAASAQAVGANAYTTGHHIAFAAGQYSPSTASGQKTMAHELTHVVQQAHGPVASTPVEDGLSVSHPSDSFEREARSAGGAVSEAVEREQADLAQSVEQSPASPNAPIVVQRATQDDANAATVSGAKAGWVSAVSGGVSALAGAVSAFESIRSANFGERSAQAAEDPPVAEPTTGGVTSNHVELPEVKGVSLKETEAVTSKTKTGKLNVDLKTKPGDLTTTNGKKTSHTTAEEGSIKGAIGGADAQGNLGDFSSETTTVKSEDKADDDKQFTVLRLQAGEGNFAEFMLTLRFNGTDVRGGATEDGTIFGYLGGSANSNAAVTFRASPGRHIPPSKKDPANGDTERIGTVRLLFGGTNAPPRKVPGQSTGFLGLGKGSPAENKLYNVQRFSFGAQFSAEGRFLALDHKNVTSHAMGSDLKEGTGQPGDPIVTVMLTPGDGAQPVGKKED